MWIVYARQFLRRKRTPRRTHTTKVSAHQIEMTSCRNDSTGGLHVIARVVLILGGAANGPFAKRAGTSRGRADAGTAGAR